MQANQVHSSVKDFEKQIILLAKKSSLIAKEGKKSELEMIVNEIEDIAQKEEKKDFYMKSKNAFPIRKKEQPNLKWN